MADKLPQSASVQRTYRWTQRDLLLLVNTGLLIGILIAILFLVQPLMLAHIGMSYASFFLISATANVFLLPSLFIGACTHKPGTAIVVQIPVVIVFMLLTSFSWQMIFTCLFVGFVSEVLLAIITRYRNFGLWALTLVGLLIGVIRGSLTVFGHPVSTVWSPLIMTMLLATVSTATLYGTMAALIARWYHVISNNLKTFSSE